MQEENFAASQSVSLFTEMISREIWKYKITTQK